MGFYDLNKQERLSLVSEINSTIIAELNIMEFKKTIHYFSDEDTYIRKTAYLSLGKIYLTKTTLQPNIINALQEFLPASDFRIRQTTINAAGEIGKSDFEIVRHFFEKGLFDKHHSVRNAVIGSIKKMGEVNPVPVLQWAKLYLHHENPEIRREICHGIELRGRKYPEDILPMLKELQHDKPARVRKTLVHVIGQIAYKKGCIQTVIAHIKQWENKELVTEAIEEIIDVHDRYKDFAVLTQEQARQYIEENFK